MKHVLTAQTKLFLHVLSPILIVLLCAGVCLSQDRPRIQPSGEVETEAPDQIDEFEDFDDEARAQSRFSFSLDNRIGYDTNPKLVNSDEEESAVDILRLSARMKFLEQEKVKAGGSYTFYGEFYSETSDRNLNGHMLGLFWMWLSDPVSLRADYVFSHYRVDGTQYLNKHTIAPSLFYPWGEGGNMLEMVRLSYSSNAYPDNDALEGSDWSLQVKHFVFLDAAKRKRLSVGAKYADLDADDSNEGYRTYGIDFGLKWPLAWQDLDLSADLAWLRKEYGGSRDDARVEYGAEVSKKLNRWWTVTIGFNGIDNQSSGAATEYRKNLIYISAGAEF